MKPIGGDTQGAAGSSQVWPWSMHCGTCEPAGRHMPSKDALRVAIENQPSRRNGR